MQWLLGKTNAMTMKTPTSSTFSPRFIADSSAMWHEAFLWFRPVLLVSSPPSFLWMPHFICCTGWVGTKHPQREGKPRCCASTAHKLTRHWCVISSFNHKSNPYERNWLHHSQSHHTSPQLHQGALLLSDGRMSYSFKLWAKRKKMQAMGC